MKALLLFVSLISFLYLPQSCDGKVFTRKLKFKASKRTDHYHIARFAFTNNASVDLSFKLKFSKPYPSYKKLKENTLVYVLAATEREI